MCFLKLVILESIHVIYLTIKQKKSIQTNKTNKIQENGKNLKLIVI